MNKKYLILILFYLFVLFFLVFNEIHIGNKDVYILRTNSIAGKSIAVVIKVSDSLAEKVEYHRGRLAIAPNNCQYFNVSNLNYSVNQTERNQYLVEILNERGVNSNNTNTSLCFDFKITGTMNPISYLYRGSIGPVKIKEEHHDNN